MNYSRNAINILAAKTYKGIGRAWIVKNLKGKESISTIVSLLKKDVKDSDCITVEDFENKCRTVETKILRLGNSIDGVIAIGDDDFPPYRGKVKNSEQPIIIFYKGDIGLLKFDNRNVAVIGLLNPDKNTEIIEQEVVARLVNDGATIVSGLALGCDSIAHKQALQSNGKTIAILPSPLNNILPTSNIDLANEIVRNRGLLISEYFEDVSSKMELSSRYQERDRLQALFSNGIILSASYAKNNLGNDSGSRLAMEYALSYSIPRAVIYNPSTDENNPKYDLNRQLIKEEKKIIVINRKNLAQSISKIILNNPNVNNNHLYQLDLFNTL